MVTVIQAYRFALDPTAEQQAALPRIKANLDRRVAEKSCNIPDSQLTPSVSWSAYGLRKDWPRR